MLAPVICATSIAVLDLLDEKGAELRATIQSNAQYFREKMTAAGFDLLPGEHAIIPVMIYDAALAGKMAEEMLKRGIYVTGFSYPVVPEGRARIRTQMSAAHTKAHLDKAIESFVAVGKDLKIVKKAA